MMSGADWTMSGGDMLVALRRPAAVRRGDESRRASARAPSSITALSLLLFVGMLAEFLLVKQAATATFFLLLVISFVECSAASR